MSGACIMQLTELPALDACIVADNAVISAASTSLLAPLPGRAGQFVFGSAGSVKLGGYLIPPGDTDDAAQTSAKTAEYDEESGSASLVLGSRLPIDGADITFLSASHTPQHDHGSFLAVACRGTLQMQYTEDRGAMQHCTALGSINAAHDSPWRAVSWLHAPAMSAPAKWPSLSHGAGPAFAAGEANGDAAKGLSCALLAAVCQVR